MRAAVDEKNDDDDVCHEGKVSLEDVANRVTNVVGRRATSEDNAVAMLMSVG